MKISLRQNEMKENVKQKEITGTDKKRFDQSPLIGDGHGFESRRDCLLVFKDGKNGKKNSLGLIDYI